VGFAAVVAGCTSNMRGVGLWAGSGPRKEAGEGVGDFFTVDGVSCYLFMLWTGYNQKIMLLLSAAVCFCHCVFCYLPWADELLNAFWVYRKHQMIHAAKARPLGVLLLLLLRWALHVTTVVIETHQRRQSSQQLLSSFIIDIRQ
jgi:hypothetical protein